VSAERRFSRVRFLIGVCTGGLARSRVYEEYAAPHLHVRARGPMRLARDGETFDGPAEFEVRKSPKPVSVFVPER